MEGVGGFGLSALWFATFLPTLLDVPGICFATVWRGLRVAHSVKRQGMCQGLPASQLCPAGTAPLYATRCPRDGGSCLFNPPFWPN